MASDGGPAVVFRAATLEDAPAILRLLEAAFGRWPDFAIDVPALEHLRWKMQPPDGLRASHTVGLIDEADGGADGGEAIAVELRWLSLAQLGGRTVVTNDGVDQAVDPRFQGRGLSGQLNDADSAQQPIGELGIEISPRVVDRCARMITRRLPDPAAGLGR